MKTKRRQKWKGAEQNRETERARYIHPECFGKRVRICLIVKELRFARATKSLQQYRNKGVSLVGRRERTVVCRANMTYVIILVHGLSRVLGLILGANVREQCRPSQA